MPLFYVLGIYLANKQSHYSLFFKTLGMIFSVLIIILFADSAILTTPFILQDQLFYHLDNLLHFNLVHFLQAIRHKQTLAQFLEIIYASLFLVIKVVPLLLAALNEATQVYKYIFNFLISCLLGFSIYYFWPSTDPSSVIHSVGIFSREQYYLTTQFNAIHNHQSLSFYQAGLISFPSYHTIWAIIVAYTCWPRKILFYFVSLFSFMVIIATLASGWHFLIDILGGILISLLSIFITNSLMNQKCAKKTS